MKPRLSSGLHTSHDALPTRPSSDAVQGWTKDDAPREMTQGGFGYDDLFPNLEEYLRKLVVEKVKREAGLQMN